MSDLGTRPHRRLNPLTGEWVLVSPQRLARPWRGEIVPPAPDLRPAYDPECYLCPGNVRAGGARNPAYGGTYAFDNDYAALSGETPAAQILDPLFTARAERGRCRVLCFSPRHDLDMGSMDLQAVRGVVDAWVREHEQLAEQPYVRAVTIFENRGSAMGASNPHPHGQVWANAELPNEIVNESRGQQRYLQQYGSCLLCAYAEREIALGERVVFATEEFCAVVPFWAVWPFEVLLLPRRHAASLPEFTGEEREALAAAIQSLVRRYDRLFQVPFPYSMGFHQAPCGEDSHPEWHAHAHYFPPLLRSASVRKYMVGYELLAQPQRDLTPEAAAERLREL